MRRSRRGVVARFGGVAGEKRDRVIEDRRERAEAALGSPRAAGQVDDQRPPADGRSRAREHGVRCLPEAGGAQGLGDPGHLAVGHRTGGVRGHVAGRETRAPRRQDEGTPLPARSVRAAAIAAASSGTTRRSDTTHPFCSRSPASSGPLASSRSPRGGAVADREDGGAPLPCHFGSHATKIRGGDPGASRRSGVRRGVSEREKTAYWDQRPRV